MNPNGGTVTTTNKMIEFAASVARAGLCLGAAALSGCASGAEPLPAHAEHQDEQVALPHFEALPAVPFESVKNATRGCQELKAGDELAVTEPGGLIAVWRRGQLECVDTREGLARALGNMIAPREGARAAGTRQTATARQNAAGSVVAAGTTAMKPGALEPEPQPSRPTTPEDPEPTEPTPQPSRPRY